MGGSFLRLVTDLVVSKVRRHVPPVSLTPSANTTSGGIENFSCKDTPQFRANHATENRVTGPLSTSRLRRCIIATPGLCEWLGVDRDGPLRCSGPIGAHSCNWESSLAEEFSISEPCCLPVELREVEDIPSHLSVT